MFFGPLTSRNSLGDICLYLKAPKSKLYHLGIKGHVNQSTLSRANEDRDWKIYADFGQYFIDLVRPLYETYPIPNLSVPNEVFAMDSTTISLSLKLFIWAPGKYSRGAIKIHTLLDLRGNIPSFILVTDGKYQDSNALDELLIAHGAIYIMDKAYIDFAALFNMNESGALFISKAKSKMNDTVNEHNFNIDPQSGLRSDKTIVLNLSAEQFSNN